MAADYITTHLAPPTGCHAGGTDSAFGRLAAHRAAFGDYDNDGRLDVLATDLEGAPLLLHNERAATGHWLWLRLEPAAGRTAGGAEVVVHAGGRRWFRRATTGGSYLSASDSRVHVGLGAVAAVERVEVRWPDGMRQTLPSPAIDRETVVKQTGR